jgi:hypothetical protein
MHFNQYFCNESQAYLGLTEILGISGIYTETIKLGNLWTFKNLIINPPLLSGPQIVIFSDLRHNGIEIKNAFVATYNISPTYAQFSVSHMEIKFSAQNIIRRIFL